MLFLTGVECQDNCTYEQCSQLLNSLADLTTLSTEYCIRHNQTLDCVNRDLLRCGNVNSETAFTIFTELLQRPSCDSDQPTTSTETPTPTSGSVDCSYTDCNDLFHALNPNDTSYCTKRAEVYNCLNTTLHLCPNGGNILNHDSIRMVLDELPSSLCTCVRCSDLFDALTALSPSDDGYCELHDEVAKCAQRILNLCRNDDSLFWHAVGISSRLGLLPNCSVTTLPPTCQEPTCINGDHDCHPLMELNDGLPNFIDANTNCATERFEENFYYCGVYSYSHLRAFNSNYLHTCSSPGLWALFSHPSLKVTALNSVRMDGPYTVVDEVSTFGF